MPTTVLLVDDHDLIRQGLRRAFERSGDHEVVAEAGTVAEGMRRAHKTLPDVVITDVRLPDGTGLDLARTLRAQSDRVGIVVLTMYGGDKSVLEALASGASAFVSKDAPSEDVVAAARHAMASPRSFTTKDLVGAMQRKARPGRTLLSPRETEILALLADGLGIAPVARRLHVSESTAKTHISRIYEKLGAANRAQAIAKGMRAGLLPEPDTRAPDRPAQGV